MNVRTLCLALLAHGEATGYDLKKRWTDGPFAHFVDASFGSIYPALARLEEEGLVTCREEAQPGKPARKVYSITPAGQASFVAAMSQPPGPDIFRSSFGVVAMCAPFLSAEVVRRAIDERVAESTTMIEELEGHMATCTYPPLRWVLSWGLLHHRSELSFMKANRAALEDIAGRPDLAAGVAAGSAICGADAAAED